MKGTWLVSLQLISENYSTTYPIPRCAQSILQSWCFRTQRLNLLFVVSQTAFVDSSCLRASSLFHPLEENDLSHTENSSRLHSKQNYQLTKFASKDQEIRHPNLTPVIYKGRAETNCIICCNLQIQKFTKRNKISCPPLLFFLFLGKNAKRRRDGNRFPPSKLFSFLFSLSLSRTTSSQVTNQNPVILPRNLHKAATKQPRNRKEEGRDREAIGGEGAFYVSGAQTRTR